MVGIEAPSIRLKALRLPPSSRIATFSVTPSSLAFATAAFTIFCASSEEMLCFFTTLAIGHLPFLVQSALAPFVLFNDNPKPRVQKQCPVFNEELWILWVRPVFGPGGADKRGIRRVLQ